MKDVWRKRKFWLILFVVMVIGLAFYLVFLLIKTKISEEKELSVEFAGDTIPPLTLIMSPQDQSWHNTDFWATIYDSDIGGSGLASFVPGREGCRYLIKDFGSRNVVGDYRQCEKTQVFVRVGEGKVCSSSYRAGDPSQGKCRVSAMAFDKAGNMSGWRSSDFNIDLIKPQIGEIASKTINLGDARSLLASISENHKITSCWLFVNDKPVETQIEINPIPCKDGVDCSVSTTYTFSAEGDYSVLFSCKDYAGNYGYGIPAVVRVTTSHPPSISACKVAPAQGSYQTDFLFEVEASDPDKDALSFHWDFGDGESSTKQNPLHTYQTIGTFMPRVTVSDGKEKVSCSTAWISVFQE